MKVSRKYRQPANAFLLQHCRICDGGHLARSVTGRSARESRTPVIYRRPVFLVLLPQCCGAHTIESD